MEMDTEEMREIKQRQENLEKQFGYSLTSRQLYKFRHNSTTEVQHALSTNIQEYLEYQGVKQKDPSKLFYLLMIVICLVCSGLVWYVKSTWSKRVDVYVICLVINLAILYTLNSLPCFTCKENCVLLGSGEIAKQTEKELLLEPKHSIKNYIKSLEGLQLEILIECEDWSTMLTLKTVLYRKDLNNVHKREAMSVEKHITVDYTKYFTHDGFLYPPALIADVDKLIQSVLRVYKDTKSKL